MIDSCGIQPVEGRGESHKQTLFVPPRNTSRTEASSDTTTPSPLTETITAEYRVPKLECVNHFALSGSADAFGSSRMSCLASSFSDRWFVDETYVKVAGRRIYLYRAVDQHGQVIDVLVSERRDRAAAQAFFTRAMRLGCAPVKVTTDRAPVYPRVIDEYAPNARHVLEHYTNNVIEADHGRLKSRLRPMRGLKRLGSASTIAAGHAFVQNLRRGHYELTVVLPTDDRVRAAFTQLARCL